MENRTAPTVPSSWALPPLAAESFPYAVSLCKPRVQTGTSKSLFAEVKYEAEKCQVTSWPCLSLPLQLRLRGLLTIRVVAASNESAFLSEAGVELGSCELPLEELPKVVESMGAAGASVRSAPSELWLALRPPTGSPKKSPVRRSSSDRGAAKVSEEAEKHQRAAQFEDARLRAKEPDTPKICLLLQARQDVSSALLAMSRQNVGVAPPTEMLSSALGPSQEEIQRLQNSAGLQLYSPPAPQDPLPAEVSHSSPLEISTEHRWRAKFEEEQKQTQALEQQSSQILSSLQAEAKVICRKLDRLIGFAAQRTLQCFADMCFDAWCEWLAKEKCERQFDQLSKDVESFRKIRQRTMADLAAETSFVNRQQNDQQKREKIQRRQWSRSLLHFERHMELDNDKRILAACFISWFLAIRQARFVWKMQRAYRCARQREYLYVPWAAWCSLIGDEALGLLNTRFQAAHLVALESARSDAAARLDSALAQLARLRPAEDAFREWTRLARVRAKRRAQATCIAKAAASSRARADVSLSCCLAVWHSCASNAESRIEKERAARRAARDKRRKLSMRVMPAACGSSEQLCLRFVFLCWQSSVEQRRLQQVLEVEHAEKEVAQSQLRKRQQELQSVRAGLGLEDASWEEERADLLERLQYLQAEQEEGAKRLQELAEQRIQLEMQKADQKMRVTHLMQEIDNRIDSASRCAASEEALPSDEAECAKLDSEELLTDDEEDTVPLQSRQNGFMQNGSMTSAISSHGYSGPEMCSSQIGQTRSSPESGSQLESPPTVSTGSPTRSPANVNRSVAARPSSGWGPGPLARLWGSRSG